MQTAFPPYVLYYTEFETLSRCFRNALQDGPKTEPEKLQTSREALALRVLARMNWLMDQMAAEHV